MACMSGAAAEDGLHLAQRSVDLEGRRRSRVHARHASRGSCGLSRALAMATRRSPSYAQQCGGRGAAVDEGDLPREVVRVLQPGVGAERAGRRELVRRVTEDVAMPCGEARGDERVHSPRRHRPHVDLDATAAVLRPTAVALRPTTTANALRDNLRTRVCM